MLYRLVALSMWGGLVALDTTAVLQVLISHPLVSCSVVGFLLGNFKIAFMIGVVLELIWLNELPVGAAPFSEGNIGATVAAATAILVFDQTQRLHLAVPLACLLGVAVSAVGGHMVIWARHLNGRLYTQLLGNADVSPARVTATHGLSIVLMFLAGAGVTAVSTALSYYLIMAAAPYIPLSWDDHLWPVMGAFLGVGCAVLLYLFVSRKNWWLLLMGVALGALFLIV